MKRTPISVLSLACTLAAASTLIHATASAQSAPAHASHVVKPASELQWVDLPSLPPGAKFVVLEGPMNQAVPFTARIRMPANYRVPAHWHPAVERLSILSGTLHVGMGEKLETAGTVALSSGGFTVMPPQSPHFVYTTNEPVELQLHGTGPWGITYINPEDDPRRKLQ